MITLTALVLFAVNEANPDLDSCIHNVEDKVCDFRSKAVAQELQSWFVFEYVCLVFNLIVALSITISSWCDKEYPDRICCEYG